MLQLPQSDADRRACLLIARAPSLHADHFEPLFRRGASLTDIVALPPDELAQFALPPLALRWLRSPDSQQLDSDLLWLERSGVSLVAFGANDYPPALEHIDAPPLVLYVRGDPAVLRTTQLAVVGSRNPTAQGIETATRFAGELVQSGLVITSGLALGIDAAAHQGALNAGGATIAVCGTGLDAVYPAVHEALAERIATNGGALVSEFPPGTDPHRRNFPRRNRVISGLARATLVVEAAHASGSLITARLAGAQGREVFVIPGSIYNPLAHSCHQLVRRGMAELVTSPAEILADLKLPFQKQPVTQIRKSANPPSGLADGMDKEYEILLDALGFEPASIDALVDRTGLPGEQIASLLLIFELEGRVEPQPGGHYCRLS
ncbi:MAG: DNA-processing protein DprA [Steroidobacteraceae bacterium]